MIIETTASRAQNHELLASILLSVLGVN